MVDTRTLPDNIARYLNALIATIRKENPEPNNQRGCLSNLQHASMIKKFQRIDSKKGVKRVKMTKKLKYVNLTSLSIGITTDISSTSRIIPETAHIMDTLNIMTCPIYPSLQGCWMRKKKKQCIM